MKNLYIGLMSGTSVDAVDAVLVEFFKNDFIIHESHSIDFPKDLQTDIQHLLSSFKLICYIWGILIIIGFTICRLCK